eukprot:COSAG02_NODE_183_length_30560_cov_8.912695_19_plen_61_part_00
MGMRPLDERAEELGPASAQRSEAGDGFEEQKREAHLVDVDVTLIDRFNPAGRGAALLKDM